MNSLATAALYPCRRPGTSEPDGNGEAAWLPDRLAGLTEPFHFNWLGPGPLTVGESRPAGWPHPCVRGPLTILVSSSLGPGPRGEPCPRTSTAQACARSAWQGLHAEVAPGWRRGACTWLRVLPSLCPSRLCQQRDFAEHPLSLQESGGQRVRGQGRCASSPQESCRTRGHSVLLEE